MSRCVSHTRTIKSTKLRWKILKNFPDKHRPSNGLYTVLPTVLIPINVKINFSFVGHLWLKNELQLLIGCSGL